MKERKIIATEEDRLKALRALLVATDSDEPKQEHVEALATFLHHYPELWTYGGDLIEQATARFIREMEARPAVRKSLEAGLRHLQQELGRPDDTPLERLLIQQVVLCWLHLGYVEYRYSGVLLNPEMNLPVADFWERRLNAAQRRYIRATQALARIRRLQLPALQINIGAQQVNQLKEKS